MSFATDRADAALPADVEDAVRTTAARVPAAPWNLTAIPARARTFRRRRAALGAGAAAVAVLAASATVPALRSVTSPENVVAGDQSGRHPIALWLDRDEPPVTRGLPPGRHVPGSSGDIAAQLRIVDGRPTITPVGPQLGPGEWRHLGPAPLPGGGLATIGRLPDSRDPAGSSSYQVVVVDAGGRTVVSRPLPPTDAGASRPVPMTGSGTTLFWWQTRLAGDTQRHVLLTYDIGAGTLRELTPASAPTGTELPYFGMQATADRIIEWPARFGENCSADVRDATTGERVALLRPAITGCADATFALSPDDRHAAVLVTQHEADSWSQRVVIVDVSDGAVVKQFDTPPATEPDHSRLVYGIEWDDATNVRYVRGVLPEAGRTAPEPVVLTFAR